MPKGKFGVARVGKRTRESVGKFERAPLSEKNESYENMNVDLSGTPMNVYSFFKVARKLTYNERLDRLIQMEHYVKGAESGRNGL